MSASTTNLYYLAFLVVKGRFTEPSFNIQPLDILWIMFYSSGQTNPELCVVRVISCYKLYKSYKIC